MKKFFLFFAAIILTGCSFLSENLKQKADEIQKTATEKISETKNQISAEIENAKEKAGKIKADVLNAKNQIDQKITEIKKTAEEIAEAKAAIDQLLGGDSAPNLNLNSNSNSEPE